MMRMQSMRPCLAALAVLVGLAGATSIARADDLLGNWAFGEASGATSFADSSGNGNTGTLVGSDSVVSMNGGAYPASPVGTGVYFNGLSGTGNYVSVPYKSALSGMMELSLSAWIYLPSAITTSTPKEEIFSLFSQTGGNKCYQFGFGYALPTWLTFQNNGSYYDQNFVTNNHQTPGQWMLLSFLFNGGSPSTGVNWATIYENGVCMKAGEFQLGGGNGTIPIPAAKSGQPLELAGGDNEWTGGLSDLGIWNTDLTTGGTLNQTGGLSAGNIGGEVSALYFTPTSGFAALSQYGVSAMDKLFTLYDGKLGTATSVTTGNGTLNWQYVASGLPGTNGYAGKIAGTGQYFVQLDANGGGVETCFPGDANLDGRVDINDLTIVLAHYNQSGMTWSQGDFNGDGRVDINDLTIVLANYNQTSGAAAGIAPVPEPATLALLAAALLGAAVFARRKR